MPNDASVLFVCLGNICRSPAAEGIALHLTRSGPDPSPAAALTIDSAGTAGYHVGAPADARMQEAASRRGIELPSRARRVEPDDFRRFDLIVAMDRSNLRDLEAMRPADATAELALLSDFAEDGAPVDVPDPYYGGDQGFDTVLDLLQDAVPRVLEHARTR